MTDAPETLALPNGFLAYTGHVGLRDAGDDIAVVLATGPCSSAAVFTKSRFAGPSVLLSRENAAAGAARGIVTVAKNANVATGEHGMRNAATVVALVSQATQVPAEQLLIASTGVVGRQYPMPLLEAHLRAVTLSDFRADAVDVARAIMTTDTVPKTAERTVGSARLVGVAKGVGMIEPNMATMLAYVMTDAAVDSVVLDGLWRSAVDASFNSLSIDTDTSTSDTAVVLASGTAGEVDRDELLSALHEICLDLTLQLARDGEGATKLITVTVSRARDAGQAKRVAKAIVNSPLVKTAVHGADPNWGRVAMAIGKCSDDTDIEPESTVIRFGELELYPRDPGEAGLAQLREIMAREEVHIAVELGTGPAEATVYGCDLSDGYIRINADYTT